MHTNSKSPSSLTSSTVVIRSSLSHHSLQQYSFSKTYGDNSNNNKKEEEETDSMTSNESENSTILALMKTVEEYNAILDDFQPSLLENQSWKEATCDCSSSVMNGNDNDDDEVSNTSDLSLLKEELFAVDEWGTQYRYRSNPHMQIQLSSHLKDYEGVKINPYNDDDDDGVDDNNNLSDPSQSRRHCWSFFGIQPFRLAETSAAITDPFQEEIFYLFTGMDAATRRHFR